MKRKRITRLLAILLTLTMLFSVSGCRSVSVSKNYETESSEQETTKKNTGNKKDKDSKEAKAEQKKFNEYMDEIFRDEIKLNIMNLHCTLAHPENYGIDDYEISLGSFSKEEDEKSYELLEKYMKELGKFDYDLLTSEQQLTYDILKTYLQDSVKYEDFRLYNNYMSPLNGVQSYLPTLLAEYVFYDKQDVEDYLDILESFPKFFEDLMGFEKEQSEEGFFMPDFEVDKVVDQCQEFIADPENHYMIDSFNTRIEKSDFLTTEDKESYRTANAALIKDTVIPAYQYIIDELPKLKGTCKNEGGLANYKNGKKYYEMLVRDSTGSDKSVEEIKEMIEKKYKADFREVLYISMEDYEVLEHMLDCPVDLSDPVKILNDLKSGIKKDFPAAPNKPFTVNYVPSSMEKYTSPAYYILPPIDNLDNNIIYINQSLASEDIEDFVTLAHEGFPGHLYQTTYFYSSKPQNIRKLLSFSGYTEGWGTYSEIYAYSLAGLDDNVQRLNELNKTYTFAVYCLADIGINYEGWTYDETLNFLSGIGFSEEDSKSIYETMVEEPSLYLAYYVGYLEFMELREEAERTLGDDFSLKEFHTFILETGPAQFELIHERLQDWINEQVKTSA
ncbi:MAG: DUF885 domain-containing protein [Lachnospiraceae bacterium]|nr:DUF885 domain-containing protein [Lachnospiraceae bacterium]